MFGCVCQPSINEHDDDDDDDDDDVKLACSNSYNGLPVRFGCPDLWACVD